MDARFSAPRDRISPMAVALTAAAVVLAMVVGLTGPRLRDRHASSQQEMPIGELAFAAEHREAQQAFDVARRSAAPVTPERLETLSREVFDEPHLAPSLSARGFDLLDARVVELTPGTRALALFHRAKKGDGVVTLYGVRDAGRFVRHDGFGRALPLAPGDEWASSGLAERDGPPRVLYAVTDGSTLWLMLAPDARTVVDLATALAPQVPAQR